MLLPILGIGIPTFFVLLWVTITSAIVAMSGWGRLQRRFPVQGDSPRLILSGQYGLMGASSFKGLLRLDACPLGLRVGKTRLIGPFHGSFEVPRGDIRVEPTVAFRGARVLLRFGTPEVGTLAIAEEVWKQLSAHRGV